MWTIGGNVDVRHQDNRSSSKKVPFCRQSKLKWIAQIVLVHFLSLVIGAILFHETLSFLGNIFEESMSKPLSRLSLNS